jgi:hypothetical protein
MHGEVLVKVLSGGLWRMKAWTPGERWLDYVKVYVFPYLTGGDTVIAQAWDGDGWVHVHTSGLV